MSALILDWMKGMQVTAVVCLGFAVLYVIAHFGARFLGWLMDLILGPANDGLEDLEAEYKPVWKEVRGKDGRRRKQFYMRSECAWCHADLGLVPCVEEQALMVTHGMCPKCHQAALAQIGETPVTTLPK